MKINSRVFSSAQIKLPYPLPTVSADLISRFANSRSVVDGLWERMETKMTSTALAGPALTTLSKNNRSRFQQDVCDWTVEHG